MANKLLFLVFLQIVYGVLCQQDRANNLNYPIDCLGDEVYPWFEGCGKYLQCNGAGQAALLDCPQIITAKLRTICPAADSADSCGYTCDSNTIDIIHFVAPNATQTSYYAMCIKGVIVRQSRCRSNIADLMPRFDSVTKQCTFICQDGYVTVGADCTSYTECVNNNMIQYRCPPGSLFDGDRCNFRKQTC